MYTNILVAIDGSEYAGRAIAAGADLALRYGARLSLLTVVRRADLREVEENLRDLETMEHVTFSKHDLLELAGRTVLDEGEKTARNLGITDLVVDVAEGHPAEQIIGFAKENGVDLIVMGSRGLSDLPGLLLGSVSHKVIHLSDMPVLVVR